MALPEEDPPPGVPEWVVTYGDMMSLLLTFFIMLVSLSEVAGDKKYMQVLESIQKGIGYRSGKLSPPGKGFPLNSMVEQLSTLGAHSDTGEGRGGVKTLQSVEGADSRVYVQRHGKPIPAGPPIFFDHQQSTLTDEARRRLETIAQTLSGKPNKIEIRGHTSSAAQADEHTVVEQFALSYARARLVFDVLAAQGIEKDRMRILALGDNEPPEIASGAQTAQADRVEVVVLDVFSSEYVGPKHSAKSLPLTP